MKKNIPISVLFAVILLEGYVVLSAELLAIRQSIPFVGSGTDTVAIIIASVLMPLAFGYYQGGKFRPGFQNGRYFSIRRKLISNMLISLIIFVIGLSYMPMQEMLTFAIQNGFNNRLLLTTIYAGIFLVIPVYLLGQTIPLISHYFPEERLARVTGRILFVSTLGSFMGAVFTTVVLVTTIGVNNTLIVIFVTLAILIMLLSRSLVSFPVIAACIIAGIGAFINSNEVMLRQFNIIKMNNYNTIAVREIGKTRHLILNNNPSSSYNQDTHFKYSYINFAEHVALDPIRYTDEPRDILVIGAGAFTFGHEDRHNNYIFVDIDYDLKEIGEEHILQNELPPNHTFHAMPARAYLAQDTGKYDLIFLDTYFGRFTLPEHLATREYFQQVKDHLKEGGVVIANFITSPNFANPFSRNIDNTFRSVFPHVSRHIINEKYLPWNDAAHEIANVMYIYRHHADAESDVIYTDNKNRAFLDMPQKQK